MKGGRGQFMGTISTMPCHVHWQRRGEFGGEGNFGRFVPFPAGVVWAPGGAEWKAGFRHGDARDDRAGRGIKGPRRLCQAAEAL